MSVIDFMDRPIAFNRAFVSLGIGINAALMLSQCVYWSTRTSRDDGWFYKTRSEWEEETGLTRREQECARAKLAAKGYLSEKKKGVPCKVHFQLNTTLLEADLLSLAESAQPVGTKSTNQNGGKRPTEMAESAQQDGTEQPDSDGGNCQSITETTTEITSDIPDGKIQHQKIVDLYNEILPELKSVRAAGPERQKHIRARIAEDPRRKNLGWWKDYFVVVSQCPHLMGLSPPRNPGDKPWKARFDWLINPNNMLKVLEGQYDPD